MDPEILINYITEILGLVEHSAFKCVVEKAATRDDQNAGDFEKWALKRKCLINPRLSSARQK